MVEAKACATCHETKPIEEFGRDKQRANGRKGDCKPCRRAKLREWYKRNPKSEQYRQDTKERSKLYRRSATAEGKCLDCAKPHDGKRGLRCDSCAQKHCDRIMATRAKDRALCMEAYGGAFCACCGETEPQFLTIDHVDSDGAKHRRTISGVNGGTIYCWLRQRKFPAGYRILCYNCNCGRARNGGICPHKEEAVAASA